MKSSHLMYFTVISVLVIGASFDNRDEMKKLKIKIAGNTQIFTATLLDNNTANAFKKMLPLTIKMNELNGNEKLVTYQTVSQQIHLFPRQ
jgi:hypothetical protein